MLVGRQSCWPQDAACSAHPKTRDALAQAVSDVMHLRTPKCCRPAPNTDRAYADRNAAPGI